jgi:SAM-dependent methyltransferase
MQLEEIEKIIRTHSYKRDTVSLDLWLTMSTLCRLRDWVPRPTRDETTIMDIGCYLPAIGYYAAMGWRNIVGVSKEEGEFSTSSGYRTANGATVRTFIVDVEREQIPQPNSSVDVILMMEIFEHFGLDPMHALIEANRVLKSHGLLVLSTPNAGAFHNVYRLLRGEAPYTGLEFSGFSTNRHNRIYDCREMREILRAAGFDVEICTSRSYEDNSRQLKTRIFRNLLLVSDALLRFRGHQQIERGDFLFLLARKKTAVFERYPRSLYFDSNQWPEWFRTIRETRIIRTGEVR